MLCTRKGVDRLERQNENAAASLREKKAKRRYLWPLLLLLCLLTLFSSVIAGFLIGRNSVPYRGQMIDNIVIAQNENRAVHIAGQVLYSNGEPYANGRVELRSEPRAVSTDARGRFFYDGVEPGAHRLSVVDQAGKVLASCEVSVSRYQEEQPVSIRKRANGQYALELSVHVRFIELAVEIDRGSAALKLIPEKTVALEDGGILTADGKRLNVAKGTVVLPSGTVVLTNHTVVVPGHLILPDNNVMPIPEGGYSGANGEKVRKDGSVILPDGTTVTEDGIKKPDGAVVQPEEPYQIVPQEQTGGSASPSAKPGGSEGEDTTATPPATTAPPDNGTLSVKGNNTDGWAVFQSESSIDLFYNRTGTAENGALRPGSKGYYLFQMENGRKEALTYTISLSEKSFHLPMRMRLVDGDGKAGDWQTLREGEAIRLGSGTIADSALTYRLEWEWLYEGGDDAADTAAGSMQSRTYIVTLQVRAS